MTCIYKITNLETNKIYIGSAISFKKRCTRHLRDLKNKKHHSIFLQRAWDKYGEHNFIFQIIEEVKSKELLLEREQYYIDNLKPAYNISPTAGSSLGIKRSEEFKNKLRNANLGKIESDITRLRKSISTKGIDNHKGKPRPKLGDSPRARKIIQYDLEGNKIKEWSSVSEAAKSLNKLHGNISGCCSGAFKTAYGFVWRWSM